MLEIRYDAEICVCIRDLMYDDQGDDFGVRVEGRLNADLLNTMLDGAPVYMTIWDVRYYVWIVEQSRARYEDGTFYVEVSIIVEVA